MSISVSSRMGSYSSKRRVFISTILIVLGMGTCLLGQEVSKRGTAAAVFLRIPVGARGMAIGSANASRADDASVMYWNPAGLSRLKSYHAIFDYSSWLPGLDFGFLGITLPLGGTGVVGMHVTRLGTEKMDITTPAFPMGNGQSYTAASNALGLSFARSLTNRFSIGATFKFINERIYNSEANGLAIDVGTLYSTPFNGIRLGVSISNIGTKMQMDGEDLNVRVDLAPDQAGNNQTIVGGLRTDKFDTPLILRIGLTGEAIRSEQLRLSWMVDGVSPNDQSSSINLGTELALFGERIFLRGGYNDLFLEDNIRGMTLGCGVTIPVAGDSRLTVDYAFQGFHYLGDVSRFTVNLAL